MQTKFKEGPAKEKIVVRLQKYVGSYQPQKKPLATWCYQFRRQYYFNS
jgi:hypothetical protein